MKVSLVIKISFQILVLLTFSLTSIEAVSNSYQKEWDTAQSLNGELLTPPVQDTKLVQFGKKLFFDSSFSINGKLSCSSCHVPSLSFAEHKKKAIGLTEVRFNTPTLVNLFASRWFFWNGRATSLESQVLQTIASREEHSMDRGYITQIIRSKYRKEYESIFGRIPKTILKSKLRGIPILKTPKLSQKVSRYGFLSLDRKLFFDWIVKISKSRHKRPLDKLLAQQAPPISKDELILNSNYDSWDNEVKDEVNRIFLNFGLAIAAFQSQILANESHFDKFVQRWKTPEKPQEAFNENFGSNEFAGFKVFIGKGECVSCHHGPTFSDNEFHNIGLPSLDQSITLGRSLGVMQARQFPFNCRTAKQQKEACEELKYIDQDNLDFLGAMKTPTLRNISITKPYFHDGRANTLEEVLDHYTDTSVKAALGHQDAIIKNISMNQQDRVNLIAFLRSLASPVKFP